MNVFEKIEAQQKVSDQIDRLLGIGGAAHDL